MRIERRATETVGVLESDDLAQLEKLENRLASVMGYTQAEIEAWDRNPDRRVVRDLEEISKISELILEEVLAEAIENLDTRTESLLSAYHAAKQRYDQKEFQRRAREVLRSRRALRSA